MLLYLPYKPAIKYIVIIIIIIIVIICCYDV